MTVELMGQAVEEAGDAIEKKTGGENHSSRSAPNERTHVLVWIADQHLLRMPAAHSAGVFSRCIIHGFFTTLPNAVTDPPQYTSPAPASLAPGPPATILRTLYPSYTD